MWCRGEGLPETGAEAAGDEQGFLNLCPAGLRERAERGSEAPLLGKRHVIEVERAGHGHPIIRSEDDLCRNPANGPGDGYDDHFTQNVDDLGPAE